jgi:polar amino acid transport system substrate-binding protein
MKKGDTVRVRDLLLCLLMLVWMSHPVFAENNELAVPISEFSPWKMTDGKRFYGIDVDILHKMAERLDLKVRFIKCPFARCLEHMKQGQADLITSLLRRPDRQVYIRYLEPPYHNDRKVFYVLKGKSHILQSYGDLYSLRVGVKRRVKYFPRFDQDTNINKEDVTEVIQNMEKLAEGRIDAFINSETQGDYLVAISGFQRQFEKAQVTFEGYDPVHFGLSKHSKFVSRVADFEKVLAELVEEGQIETIKRDFISQVVVGAPSKEQ